MLLSLGKKTPKTQHSIVEDCLEFHNIGHCPSSCTYLSNHVKEESYKSTYTIRVHITFSISLKYFSSFAAVKIGNYLLNK